MINEYSENWNKLYQCMIKPIIETAQLNIKTLNNITKNVNIEKSNLQNSEENYQQQMHLANLILDQSKNYTEQWSNIWLNAMNETNQFWTDNFNKTMDRLHDIAGNPANFNMANQFKNYDTFNASNNFNKQSNNMGQNNFNKQSGKNRNKERD